MVRYVGFRTARILFFYLGMIVGSAITVVPLSIVTIGVTVVSATGVGSGVSLGVTPQSQRLEEIVSVAENLTQVVRPVE